MQAAKVLASYGVKEGIVVHVVMPNCIQFHVTVFAIWLLGGIASLADPSLRTSILLEQIKETKSALMCCMPVAGEAKALRNLAGRRILGVHQLR